MGYQTVSVRTMVCPLLVPMRSMDSRFVGVVAALGIGIERIKPGNPQQNGRHERMHLTLKQATTKPPAKTLLQQQDKSEDFIYECNHELPHQALGML